MYLVLKGDEETPTPLPSEVEVEAKADHGSVASVGDQNVIINMPHFGNIMVASAKEAGTKVVSVTPEYLCEFYRKHTTIQAQRLAQAYIGQWMRVSGQIIDVHEFSGGVQVVSQRGDGYIMVSMIFEKDWQGRLAVLRKDEQITVEGTIDKLSASMFYMDKCELVDEG